MEVIADGPSERCWWMGQRGRSGDHEKYLDSEYIFKQGKKEMIITILGSLKWSLLT